MNTLIFTGGVLLGALATFVFMTICITIAGKKQADEETGTNFIIKMWNENPEMVKELMKAFSKGTKDDGS